MANSRPTFPTGEVEMMMNSTLLVVLLILVVAGASLADEPLIGFVNHFPWIDKGMDDVPRSGSNAVIFRAVSGIEAEEGKYDFSSIDRQIEFAEKNKLKIILLLEANPVYSPAWLTEKCLRAGEMQMDFNGRPHTTPSMTSGIFKAWHEKFVRAVIAHVRERDTTGVVIGYQPGAEWWYESGFRFNPAEIAAFREWLAAKYGSIDRLNSTWKSTYPGFDAVNPPKLTGSELGAADRLSPFEPAEDIANDLSWSIHTDVPIEAGTEYVFRAKVRMKDARGEGAFLQIAWRQGDNGTPIWTSNSDRLKGTASQRQLEMVVKAPDRAKSAWLLLKLHGNGTVGFDDIFFGEKGSDKNLAPSAPDLWFFDNWTQSSLAQSRFEARHLTIDMPRDQDKPEYGNVRAAAYDWFTFGSEFFGDYIERFCKLVKHADPSRLTVGYLTYAFAFPVEWDYTQHVGMALDVVLPKLRHMDAIGMQICSADGDPVRITAAIDLARKYGKPVYAIDVIDFTSGVAVGYPAMDAVTREAIRHAATGVFYYCWWGTPDYDYYTGMPLADLEKMLTRGRRSAADAPSRVAIIQPILPTVFASGPIDNNFMDFVGLYKAVTDSGAIPDIWTLHELAEQRPDLRARYDVVFLPDCAYCLPGVPRMLSDFIRRGGKVVTSGRLPQVDQIGNKISARLDGAVSLGSFGADYLGKVVRSTSAGNTPPLFRQMDVLDLQKRRVALRKKIAGFLPTTIEWSRESHAGEGFKCPLELRNGDILVSRTVGVKEGGVSIACFRSSDDGLTWSKLSDIVHSDEPGIDIGDGHMIQLRNGDILYSYRRNLGGQRIYRLEVAISTDNGATWKPHSEVVRSDGEFRGLWSTFLLEKSDGAIQCYYDDEDTPARGGFPRHQWLTMKTWDSKSKQWIDPVTVSRAHDPEHLSRDGMCKVVELSKNKLLCAFETVQTYPPHRGVLMSVTSDDGGKSWSWRNSERDLLYQPPNPDFNALASWMIKLSTGDLLCVFTTDEDREKPGVAATAVMDQSLKYIISRDSGKTWSKSSVVDAAHPIYFPGVCELRRGDRKGTLLVQYHGRDGHRVKDGQLGPK